MNIQEFVRGQTIIKGSELLQDSENCGCGFRVERQVYRSLWARVS